MGHCISDSTTNDERFKTEKIVNTIYPPPRFHFLLDLLSIANAAPLYVYSTMTMDRNPNSTQSK